MPKYTVRAMTFTCIDESGIDWTGSDEPYWVFSTVDVNGTSVTTNRSRVFGDVDTGEKKRFKSGPSGAGENIVWPDKGAGAGGAGPIALSVQLWDSDQGDPDKTAAMTNAAFAAAALLPPTKWVAAIPSVVREKLIGFIADDVMGSRTLLFPQARLDDLLRKKGDFFEQTFRFSGSSGDLPFDVAGGPDYDLTLQIERTSKA